MADGRDEIRQKDRTSNKYAAKKAASERLAAERAAQLRADRRRNLTIYGASILAIALAVGLIVGLGVTGKKSTGSGNAVTAAPASVTNAIADAATKTLTATPDFSTITGPPTALTGAALNGSGGKAEVLYVGAEYCPFCAATRWPLTLALSRFGTFSDLKTTYSSDTDTDPHTPTLSFYKSSYQSQYFDFVSVEHEDGAQKILEPLTTSQNSLFTSIGGGSYPFIDFGGKWAQKGASIDPGLLKGMTPESVASSLTDTSSKPAAAIRANADVYTAIICEIDGGQPSNVCTASSVTAAESALNASGQ